MAVSHAGSGGVEVQSLGISLNALFQESRSFFKFFLFRQDGGFEEISRDLAGVQPAHLCQDLQGFLGLRLGHSQGRRQQQGVGIVGFLLLGKLGLFLGLVQLLGHQEEFPQEYLGLREIGVEFHGLIQGPVGPPGILQFEFCFALPQVGSGKFGINLQGVLELQASPDIVFLLV